MPTSRKLSARLMQLQELFSRNEDWLIVINADPDAMAAAMALKRIMSHRVRKVTIARINEISRPDNLAMIRYLRISMLPLSDCLKNQATRFAMVDSQPHHNPAFEGIPFSIVIDHHPTSPEHPVEAVYTDIRPKYGAVSTLMTEYLRGFGIRPGIRLATALQYGIRTDTATFTRAGTENDLRAYQYLAAHGDTGLLTRITRSEYLPQWLKYFARAFSSMHQCGNWAYCYLGDVESPDILVLIADFFTRVHGLKWVGVCGVYKETVVVIFRGDGKVGKTYTIQRLLHDCRKGDYPTKETHGILIEDLYAKKDGERYTIRVWDFGGQDIMHEMHRCFLTDRTCYVVMIDTRVDKQTRRARYWLRTVQNIAPNAPVLLLVNEVSGGKNRDLDYSSLEKEFPNLVGLEYCSSMDASDEDFHQKVEQTIFKQALDLDSCKRELPKSWESVRQNLLSLRSGAEAGQKGAYYIDRQTFHSLCEQYDVPADDGLRAWLLTWFNDLGVCFSYHLGEDGRERPNDYKILDPMWLTSAVYKIIWEKEQTDDGLITLSEIHRILEKPGSTAMKKDGIPCLEGVTYNEQECGYVLDIMRMFRISHPADTRTEFIPALCKTDSKLDPIPANSKQHAACRFRYPLLPETVLHRLMIFCYANLRPGRRWRKGFLLECESQGLSAVIQTEGPDSEENELQIDVYAQREEYAPAALATT